MSRKITVVGLNAANAIARAQAAADAVEADTSVATTAATTATSQAAAAAAARDEAETAQSGAEVAKTGAETARDEATAIVIADADTAMATAITTPGTQTGTALSTSNARAVVDGRPTGLNALRRMTPVGSHCQPTQGAVVTHATGMTRSRHVLGRGVSQLALAFAGWYWDGATLAEKDNTATLTIRAAIEQPNGTIVPVFLNGKRDFTVEPGATVVTDAVSFDHPGPAAGPSNYIYVRTYVTTSSGNYAHTTTLSSVARAGEGVENGAAVTDKTLTGTVTEASGLGGRGYGPVAILDPKPTAARVILAAGDSLVEGNDDSTTTSGGTKDIGFLDRALRGQVPFIKIGCGSDKADLVRLWANSYRRRTLLAGVTDAIVSLGINDLRGTGGSFANLQPDLLEWWTWLDAQGINVWACTVAPFTTSTDSWATLENQTVSTTIAPADRLALNDWIRTTPTPLAGYFEVADTVESARNSNKWKVNGSANYMTQDGLHPRTTGHIAMATGISLAPLLAVPRKA